jgi:hypothetical protein
MPIELKQPVVVIEPEKERARVASCRVSGFSFVDETGAAPFVLIAFQALSPAGAIVSRWSRRIEGEELAVLMAVKCSGRKSRYEEINAAVYAFAKDRGEFSKENLRAVLGAVEVSR